jgi:hypothetical protein
VDIVAAPADGGLVVDATERIDGGTRPLQTVRCAVYENPDRVICDQNLAQLGEVPGEIIDLLTYLGRGFYDPARLDAKNHWSTSADYGGGDHVFADYTVVNSVANSVTISLKRGLQNGPLDTRESGSIDYEPSLTVPTKIRLANQINEGRGDAEGTLDLQLVSDSFVKP